MQTPNTTQLPLSGIKKRGNHGLKLTSKQALKLKGFVDGFETRVAAASKIGIDRNVLDRVLLVGSGKKETIEKIIAVL